MKAVPGHGPTGHSTAPLGMAEVEAGYYTNPHHAIDLTPNFKGGLCQLLGLTSSNSRTSLSPAPPGRPRAGQSEHKSHLWPQASLLAGRFPYPFEAQRDQIPGAMLSSPPGVSLPSAPSYLVEGSKLHVEAAVQALPQQLQRLDQILLLLPKVTPKQTLRTGGSMSPQPETPSLAVISLALSQSPLQLCGSFLSPLGTQSWTKRAHTWEEPEAHHHLPHSSVYPPPANSREPLCSKCSP